LSDSGPSRPEPSRDATGDVIATVTVEVHGVKEAGVLPWPGRWAGRVSVPLVRSHTIEEQCAKNWWVKGCHAMVM
jgi:hypothetical protein